MSASGGKTDDEKEPNKTNNDDTKEMSSFASHTDSDDMEEYSPLSPQEKRKQEMIKRSLGYKEVVVSRSRKSKTYILFPPGPRLATMTTGIPVERQNKRKSGEDSNEKIIITESTVHAHDSDTTEESSDKNKKPPHQKPRIDSKP
jgi:hypothetical protein